MRLKISSKRNPRFEAGLASISYVWYFVAIMIAIILYVVAVFQADLLIVESVLENGLHLIENIVITTNSESTDNNNLNNQFDRMKIIMSSTCQNSNMTTEELSELDKIAKIFQDTFVDELDLTDSVHPNSGILKKVCGSDSKVLITKVMIYEPIYEIGSIDVTPVTPIEPAETGFVDKTLDFNINYKITGWAEYEIVYNDTNTYQRENTRTSKKIYSTDNPPLLKSGKPAEGATIEATLAVQLKGVKQIFAPIGSDAYFIDSDDTPTQEIYNVEVTQAMDIVIASEDSREKH